MSITPPTDVIVNRETAQLQVDATCQQIVKCIQMASDCVTKKISQSKATKKQNPWWTQSTEIAKSRKSFWYHRITYGVTAANPEMVMCTDVINYLNPNTDIPVA